MRNEEDLKSPAPLDYESVLQYVGQFGRFQKKVFFLLWFTSAAAGLAVVVFSFTGYVPDYRCRVTECDDPSYYSANSSRFGK